MFSTQCSSQALTRPGRSGLADRTGVAFPLQLSDGLDHVRLGGPLDVPPIRSTVVPDPDGDPSVPLAVLALVDRRGAVRSPRSSAHWLHHRRLPSTPL